MKGFRLDLSDLKRMIPVVLAFVALIVSVQLSPRHLVYDEIYHIELARDINDLGWRDGLLAEHLSAAGPLFAAVQLAIKPLTNLEAPGIRWPNVACLAGVVLVVAYWARNVMQASPFWAGQLLSIPFIYPGTGMALTELPSLFAFTVFGCTTSQLLKSHDRDFKDHLIAFGAGLALGIAILGRQTYLIAVPAILLTVVASPRHALLMLTVVVTAILSSIWLFILWGGLIAPHLAHVESGLHPEHALLGLTYLGIATLFVAPASVLPRSRTQLLWIALIGLTVNVASYAYFALVRDQPLVPPAASVIDKFAGKQLGVYVGFVVRWVMTAGGILWLWITLVQAWNRRRDPAHVLLVLLLLSLAAAPAKIGHLFSSRYIIGALSLVIIQFAQPAPPKISEMVRLLIGACLGLMTLWTYYAR